MKVLVGCEESQRVCIEFRKRGHEAYSNDFKDCSGGYSEWHLKMDVVDAIDYTDWDIIILHLDCTKLAVSGNKHYSKGKELYIDRIRAAKWTEKVFAKAKRKAKIGVALENPVGEIQALTKMGRATQYIEPYWFGDPESKKTGLWLYKLPKLKPTNMVEPIKIKGKNGKEYSRIHLMTEHEAKTKYNSDRKTMRSKTYPGIAKAFAEQWGGEL